MKKLVLLGVILFVGCTTIAEDEQKPKKVDSINYNGTSGSGGGTGGNTPPPGGG